MSLPSLSRTSSTASVDSSDDATSIGATSFRRTRKRFTNDQLTMLENLFHEKAHPSREERDTVARLGGMQVLNLQYYALETKSVTIWFQNKRQMERKTALSNTTDKSPSHSQPSLPSHSTLSRSSRPSLDSVASRSELPMAPPRTPTRQRNPNAAIWDYMPSSPIAAPFSPPLAFTKSQRSKRTLEWACAAARLHASRPRRSISSKGKLRHRAREVERLDLTDEDTDEAITPPGTLAGGDIRWTMVPGGRLSAAQPGAEDEDMMKAAIMLCDLGRRPSA
ncbi:hypothetical protein C0991_007502 [Blastosporella zonata]|nr:hypothetical protein C0991_007502 [Blastosporella zonata]